jgi:hypothetical protein
MVQRKKVAKNYMTNRQSQENSPDKNAMLHEGLQKFRKMKQRKYQTKQSRMPAELSPFRKNKKVNFAKPNLLAINPKVCICNRGVRKMGTSGQNKWHKP